MRPQDYEKTGRSLRAAAERMAQFMVARCPDDHLQPHLAEVRKLARDRGFEFNRINWEGDSYAFYQDDTPVAVITRGPDNFDIYSDYQGVDA